MQSIAPAKPAPLPTFDIAKKEFRANGHIPKDREVTVVKQESKIIIPEDMPYEDAMVHLARQREAEEKEVSIMSDIQAFPFDGMIALHRAIKQKYGYAEVSIPGFFGPNPPRTIKIQTPNGLEDVVIGNIALPKWETGYITGSPNEIGFRISGKVKKKYESEVNEIIALVKEFLQKESIYRGQAFKLDLTSYIEDGEVDTLKDAPQFMEISNAKLILNQDIEDQLNCSIFMLLENTEACVANKIPLKHGALLSGSYGTGKSMTAKVTARKAVDNGWTFIYLKAADQLAEGLKIAKMYAPAVIFAEDIDTAVAERDVEMNDILNTLDGIDTKDTPIITILTTNHAENIEQSFLRAGRIDTLVHYVAPDAATAQRFVSEIGGKLLASDVDLPVVGKALEGLVAAFIDEAIQKAKRFCIYRTKAADIDGKVSTEDLLRAAKIVRSHASLLKPKEVSREQKIVDAITLVNTVGTDRESFNPNDYYTRTCGGKATLERK